MLPPRAPRPHDFFDLPARDVEVAFDDAEGRAWSLRARYREAGSGSGPPLVLVHGLMTSGYSFRFVAGALAQSYRVIVPDLVGAGDTEKPIGLVYSLRNVARFLRSFLRALALDRPYVVGNSLGGLTCVRLALDWPDAARRLVNVHSPGYPMLRARALALALAVPGARRLVAWIAHRFRRRFVAANVHYRTPGMLSEEEVDEYSRPFASREGARAFAHILAESVAPSEHAGVIAELRARKARGEPFPVPLLLLWSDRDVLVPSAFGARFLADIPGSELVVLRDTSHFVQVDTPEAFVREVRRFDGLDR